MGERKNNTSRKLTPEDLKVEKYVYSPERLAHELKEELFKIMSTIVAGFPSGARIGVLTGGGVDSVTVLSLLTKLGYRPKALTLGFGGEDDEIEPAAVAAGHLGVCHIAKVVERFLDSTASSNSVLDEPYRGACWYYEAVKLAKESDVTHLFDGLGVDEFYGGYGFRYEKVKRYVENGMGRLGSYLRGAHPYDFPDNEDMFGPKLKKIVVPWNVLLPYFDDNELSLDDQVLLADYNAKCRQNFIPLARHARAFGIDVYYPWLTDRFIDFSLRVSSELKYDHNSQETKILFRKAIRDLVPSVTMRKKKQGFGPPLMKAFELLRCLAKEVVLEGVLISEDYLDRDFYESILKASSPSPVEINKLWDAYTLEVFLKSKGGL